MPKTVWTVLVSFAVSFALLTLPCEVASAPDAPTSGQKSGSRAFAPTKLEAAYVVSGRVTRADGRPAPDLEVRAVDRTLRPETLLGRARTEPDGSYRIRFRPERADIDLIVRVVDRTGRLHAESAVMFNAPRQATINLTIAAAASTPDALRSKQKFDSRAFAPIKLEVAYVVRGRVTRADGRPAGGVEVRAMDIDLRSDRTLGQAITGTDGSYRISYEPGRDPVQLTIRVLDQSKKTELARSRIVANAGREAVIDVTLP